MDTVCEGHTAVLMHQHPHLQFCCVGNSGETANSNYLCMESVVSIMYSKSYKMKLLNIILHDTV